MKYLYRILMMVVFLFSAIACEEVLEVDPPGFPSAEGFYKSAADVEAGINGIYQIFQGSIWGGAFVHIHPHFEAATENAVVCCAWEYGIAAIARGTMNPNTGSFVAWKWDYGYQAMSRINSILEVIETSELSGMTEELEKAFIAEIRFLRAFVYADMSFLYGDVPLLLKPIDGQEAKEITRTPKAQVVEAILDDLDFAIDNLETAPRNGDIGRPTTQAALALKGKVLLYNERYAEAASTLQNVIDMEGGAVNLDPNYGSLFDGSNEASSEILFSIQYVGQDAGEGEGNFLSIHYAPNNLAGTSASTGQGWGSFHYTRALLDDYYMSDGLPIDTSPLYDPDDPFSNRDPRFDMSFFVPGDTYRGVVLDSGNFQVNGTDPLQIPMTTSKWSTSGADINFSTNANPADLVLIRYADVLLMYAEAQNEAVGPDASVYSAVNKVRDRVDMPDFTAGMTQAQMRNEIRHERKIELVMEGSRYFDLLRWRIAETVIPSIPGLETRLFDPSKNYLWPIPQNARDQSPGITQNPNY